MVANGTMGLLNCRVMTRDLWAMDHGPARQTAPFDLLLCSGKSVVAWKAWYGRKWRNGASLQLVDPSLSPGLRLRSYLKVRFRVQHGISVRKPRPPLSYFLTKRARFCALGPHCGDFCHLPWDIIKGQGSEEIS